MKRLCILLLGGMLMVLVTACQSPRPAPTPTPTIVEVATLGPGVRSIAFSPVSAESGTLLSITTDNAVELWNVTPLTATLHSAVPYTTLEKLTPDTKLIVEPRDDHSTFVTALTAFSPDGAILAIGGTPDTCAFSKSPQQSTPCKRGVVYRWAIQSGQWLAPLEDEKNQDYNGGPMQLQFGPDGQRLALLFNLNSYNDSVSLDSGSVARSQDLVASWNTQSGEAEIRQMVGVGERFRDIAFSPDGQLVALNSWAYSCFVFNDEYCTPGKADIKTALMDPGLKSERAVITYTLPEPGFLIFGSSANLAFSPDGNSLITTLAEPYPGDRPKETIVYVHDLHTFQERAQYRLQDVLVRGIAISPDSKVLLLGDDAGRLHFMDLGSGREFPALDTQLSTIKMLTLSRDGRFLAAVGKDGLARIWRVTLK